MNIKGAEGLSTEDIRKEIRHGATLVSYTYVISVVFMSFKRSSAVYLVSAGQSPVVFGLPYVALSCLLGWWGIPWGLIWTIQSLACNFSGGEDVTDEWMSATGSRRKWNENVSWQKVS
ncbi:MAG: hypothetical protein LBV12_01725 [Puniceicoccales bacterium]|jgi:hypothetical protein|nr:hypothetical protein [Puniceicoccales bacterium]